MDILNSAEWEAKYLDKNQGSDFYYQLGHKPKSAMFFNCVKLGHVVLEFNNPFNYDSINFLKSLM